MDNSYTMQNASVGRTFYAGDADVRVFVKGENLSDGDARRHGLFQKDQVPLAGTGARFGISIDYVSKLATG